MPGGFGTMDELFEALTLIQTKKIGKFPIVLAGREYWDGMFDWIKKMLVTEKMIDEKDLNLVFLADDAEHAVNHINEFYSKYMLKPNF